MKDFSPFCLLYTQIHFINFLWWATLSQSCNLYFKLSNLQLSRAVESGFARISFFRLNLLLWDTYIKASIKPLYNLLFIFNWKYSFLYTAGEVCTKILGKKFKTKYTDLCPEHLCYFYIPLSLFHKLIQNYDNEKQACIIWRPVFELRNVLDLSFFFQKFGSVCIFLQVLTKSTHHIYWLILPINLRIGRKILMMSTSNICVNVKWN